MAFLGVHVGWIVQVRVRLGGGEVAGKNTHAQEHVRVLEAVEEGLLQMQGIAPNSKQDGIFRVLCKNANGFNNRISGNQKIAKALDIKEDLDINCLLYCEHCLNLRHKENVNDFKQMFQREIACTVVAAAGRKGTGGRDWRNLLRRGNRVHPQGGEGQGGTGQMELDTLWGLRRSHDAADHGLQPMQKRTYQLWDIIPAATTVFHHKEEGPDLPQDTVSKASHHRNCTMEKKRGSNCSVHGP